MKIFTILMVLLPLLHTAKVNLKYSYFNSKNIAQELMSKSIKSQSKEPMLDNVETGNFNYFIELLALRISFYFNLEKHNNSLKNLKYCEDTSKCKTAFIMFLQNHFRKNQVKQQSSNANEDSKTAKKPFNWC